MACIFLYCISYIFSLFQNNTALNVGSTTPSLSGFRLVLNFLNSNTFDNNFGGGMAVTESQVKVHHQLTFNRNFASSGGGIALYGRCLVSTSVYAFYNIYVHLHIV